MNHMRNFYKDSGDGGAFETYASHCGRFSRRHDFDAFSMSTYQTCENCRHLSADDRCMAGRQNAGMILE